MKDNLILFLICILSAVFILAFIFGVVLLLISIISYNFVLGVIVLCLFVAISLFVGVKFG